MKLITTLVPALLLALTAGLASADQWVDGYTRSDGTQVQGHYRSDPNATVRDNYSYEGNTNPYTGEVGSNKYQNNPTSEYYNGSSSNKQTGVRINNPESGLNTDYLNNQKDNNSYWD